MTEFNNSGLINSGTSGLINQRNFEAGYGMVSVDLSKHSGVNDEIEKQISVSFRNGAKYTCDYVILLYYEKSLNINVETGIASENTKVREGKL